MERVKQREIKRPTVKRGKIQIQHPEKEKEIILK
jgi:hypothetical protein